MTLINPAVLFSSYQNPYSIDLLRKRKILLEEETILDLFQRVISALVGVEKKFDTSTETIEALKQQLEVFLDRRQIVLGSPILTNAGRAGAPTSACTVIPIDLKKSFQELQAIIAPYYEKAMGSGFDLSDLEDPIQTLLDLNRISLLCEKTTSRPPAGMALLSVEHPKVLDFIRLKETADFSSWRFNLSVGITNQFMQAVNNNAFWTFSDQTQRPAKEIFTAIAQAAHKCGEPGILFIDRIEKDNPTPSLLYKSVAPCAEVAMTPGEVCQFSYLNLAEMTKNETAQIQFDFDVLKESTELLTRILDNSVEISIEHALSLPEVIAAKRRIGIGICGTADLFIKLKMEYGSLEANRLLGDILALINYHSKKTSLALAKQRGAFSFFTSSRYFLDPEWTGRFKNYAQSHISRDMWEKLALDIQKNGLRNAGTTALPPTGLSSRIAQTSQSIEPHFSLLLGGKIKPHLKKQLKADLKTAGLEDAEIKTILQKIKAGQILSADSKIPRKIQRIYAVITEIEAQKQLGMVAEIQNFIDESISKTVNFPNRADIKEIEESFLQAYQMGLKGITVFRDGCLGPF
ncbi:MAG: hypothetical protein WC371_02835 [Parachlamydiales bacterium]|jgi:ribonucleoside-diphosphate reductase alpha chain